MLPVIGVEPWKSTPSQSKIKYLYLLEFIISEQKLSSLNLKALSSSISAESCCFELSLVSCVGSYRGIGILSIL